MLSWQEIKELEYATGRKVKERSKELFNFIHDAMTVIEFISTNPHLETCNSVARNFLKERGYAKDV